MPNFLLQAINPMAADSSAAMNLPSSAVSDDSLSLISLLVKGGPVMIPIGILFVASVYIFFERYFYIRKTVSMDSNFLFTIREMLFNGNVKGAQDYCKMNQQPIARLLEKGISRIGQPIREIEHAIQSTAGVEIYNMEKNLGFLSAIAKIAPMFGFLGTVTGMIRAFHDISLRNDINIGIISGGIYEKMITSATGLIVGIIASMFYTLLTTMIERSINKMEVTATDFVDILYKPAGK
jgi:biopolymer transport protein ExbB